MQEICAVIAAAGLGTRLKDYKKNHSTKILIEIGKFHDLYTGQPNFELGYK